MDIAITQSNQHQKKFSVDQAKQEITKEIENINTTYWYELVTKTKLIDILTDFFEKNTDKKSLSTKESLYTALGDYFLSSNRQFGAEQFYEKGWAKNKLKKILIDSWDKKLIQGAWFSAEEYYKQAWYIHWYKKIADFFCFGRNEPEYNLAAEYYDRANMHSKAQKLYKKAAEIYEKKWDNYYAGNAYLHAWLIDKSNVCLTKFAESLEKEWWKNFYELRPGCNMGYNPLRSWNWSLFWICWGANALDPESNFSKAEYVYKRAGANDKIKNMRIKVGDALSNPNSYRPSMAVTAYEKADLFESTDIEELEKLLNAYNHIWDDKWKIIKEKIQQLRNIAQ